MQRSRSSRKWGALLGTLALASCSSIAPPDPRRDAANPAPDAGPTDAGFSDAGALDGGGAADAGRVGCVPPVAQFRFSTWPTVFAGRCDGCHLTDGYAANYEPPAGMIFKDPEHPGQGETIESVFQYNFDMLLAYRNDAEGEPYLLPKAMSATVEQHGGAPQFDEGSPSHSALLDLFEKVDRAADPDCSEAPEDLPSYRQVFGRIVPKTAAQTYRSFTVQTLGRLPTKAELRHIQFGRPGERPSLNPNPPPPPPTAQENPKSNQLRIVDELIAIAAQSPAFHSWLKDSWNDVFLFRGVYSQDLDRAYEVFKGKDYGARFWPDLCGRKVPLTDEDGEYIEGEGEQPWCDLIADRFAYPAVGQPNASPPTNLSPARACDFCPFTRGGLAKFMLYGAVEEPLELIAATVQEGRPFSEIVTSEDVFMNYYTSLVYFGSADPGENDFTADMTGVPRVDGLKNGPDYVKFAVDLPDHRYFKRESRIRRTRYTQRNDPRYTTNTRTLEYYPDCPNCANCSNCRVDFPRAGVLTSAAFMKRFASNEFNLHRHRSWQTMRLFLGYDVLGNQGERISLADVDDPNGGATLVNEECSRCHEELDPVAGLFRDFSTEGYSLDQADADQWTAAIHPPGFPLGFGDGTVEVHDRELHGPPIRFLAERIAANPRFARTMVGYAWKQVMGSEVDLAVDADEQNIEARTALVLSQQRFFNNLVTGFVRRDLDMGWVYQHLFTSVWYRAATLQPAAEGDVPDSVYEGVGRFGTLTPEAYFRRIEAVYGGPWPLNAIAQFDGYTQSEEQRYKRDFFTRTDSRYEYNFDLAFGMIDASFASFFGGIDFQNSLTRAEQVNSVMTLLAQRVANEFACLTVYADLKKSTAERRFFPLLPEPSREGDLVLAPEAAVRANLVHLFGLILDLVVAADGGEVDRAYGLYADARASALAEAVADPVVGMRIPDHCRMHEANARGDDGGTEHNDADGQVRAWMAVVSYLMLQPEFLQR